MTARFPAPEAPTPAQSGFAKAIQGFSLNGLGGPFAVLLHAPELGQTLLGLGEKLRFATGIDDRLLELAILTHAAAWQDGYEWALHHGRAQRAGVPGDVIEALRLGRTPPLTRADEVTVHAAAHQLAAERRLDDATFAALRDLLGLEGAAAFAVLMGQYALLSTILAVGRVALPDTQAPALNIGGPS